MATSSLTPEEIRAAAETHRELPPEYQNAVIESFLDKIGREIDARVDARLAAYQQAPPPERRHRPRNPAFLAIASIVLGIPLTAIVATAGPHPVGFAGVLVVWVALTVINIAWADRSHAPDDRR